MPQALQAGDATRPQESGISVRNNLQNCTTLTDCADHSLGYHQICSPRDSHLPCYSTHHIKVVRRELSSFWTRSRLTNSCLRSQARRCNIGLQPHTANHCTNMANEQYFGSKDLRFSITGHAFVKPCCNGDFGARRKELYSGELVRKA